MTPRHPAPPLRARLRPLLRPLLRRLAAAVLCCAAAAAWADAYVIAHPANPTHALSRKEATDLFMGRQRTLRNGDYALLFDLPRDSAARAAFYRLLTGMELAQVNSYWARLMFGGQTMPPSPLPDETSMLNMVRRNPSAIGYVTQDPGDKAGVRVVLVLKDTEAGR